MAPKPPPQKKQRLTLAQLTSYDDILTDALVDHVYYWTNIRKNRSAYHSSRGVREEDVTKILQESVIVDKNPAKAEAQLLELPGLKKFSAALKTDKEKEDFRRHLRKYVNIYLPDCPFEVSSTNRYTVVTHEAAITARTFIKKGQTVKYLCGIQVMMTPEEEEHIKDSRRDFSIVVSSRSRMPSLFLGPARFANHDCGANARLMTTGRDGMDIIALQDIEIGDEITVTYGENYFGEDNCECLCKTCEANCRNGWTAGPDEEGKIATPQVSIEESEGYSLRRRRRLGSSDSSRTQSMTPDVTVRPHVPKKTPRSLSKFKNPYSPLETTPSSERVQTPLKRKREVENLTTTPSKTPKRVKRSPVVKEEEPILSVAAALASTIPSPASSANDSHPGSPASSAADGTSTTDATSIEEEDTIVVDSLRLMNPTISALKETGGGHLPEPLEQAKSGEAILISDSTSKNHLAVQDESASTLSELRSELGIDESSITTSKKVNSKRKRRMESPTTDTDHAPSIRIPGDFILTSRLLAEPESAWINCKICEEPFVQKDAYFTRSSCPRCERHSKLYGYMWPKTDVEDSDDEEERILDHREIHRFVDPAEERMIRKRDRGSTGSRAVTREISEVAAEEEPRGRRKRARRN